MNPLDRDNRLGIVRVAFGLFVLIGMSVLFAGVAPAQEEPAGAPAAPDGEAPAESEDQPAPGDAEPDAAGSEGESSEEEADGKPSKPEDDALPTASETPLPSVQQLLNDPERDWVILNDDKLLVVEPVFPRPETLKKIQAERDAIQADRSRRTSKAGRQRFLELNNLDVFLPTGLSSEQYRLPVKDIVEVVHHEDLMLRRATALIEEGKTREAFELVIIVARRNPDWPGLVEIRNRLAISDAERFQKEGQTDMALAMVASLYEQDPIPEQANTLLDTIAQTLVGGAIESENGRQARANLNRIRLAKADHPAVARWNTAIADHAQALTDQARQASEAGDHATASTKIQLASEFNPSQSGLRGLHDRLTTRFQILHVGVPELAPAEPRIFSTITTDRVTNLETADLFELEQFSTLPFYRSTYLELWEPTDLGRRARFDLRSQLPDWSARPALTAPQITALLSARFRTGSPTYDTRFANLVKALRVLGPYEFEMEFQRIPNQTETALVLANPLAVGLPEQFASTFTRFDVSDRNESHMTFDRPRPIPDDATQSLSRVVEHAYPTYEDAIQALDRGDVRLLTEVPAWDVPRLQEDDRFVVKQLAVPRTHLIQFHPDSEPIKNGELRKALAVAVNSDELLKIVIGDGTSEFGRLVSAPFPSTHAGYDSLVLPRETDLALAFALTLGTKKALGGEIPPLKFVIPNQSPGREAATSLAKTWERIGLTIETIDADALTPETQWDLAYRDLALADPVRNLGPLITLDPSVEIDTLVSLPDWLRQRLVDLERASDAATTQEILLDLHRQLAADVRCIPLFEIDQFMVSRGEIPNQPARPITPYQHAERWQLTQDYPEVSQ